MKYRLLAWLILFVSMQLHAQTDVDTLDTPQIEIEEEVSGADIAVPADTTNKQALKEQEKAKKQQEKAEADKQKELAAQAKAAEKAAAKQAKDSAKAARPPREKLPPDSIPRPTLGASVGVLSFYGDIKSNENTNNSLFIGDVGYEFTLSQRLDPAFQVSLNVLFGRLSANERSLDRNLNFESHMWATSLNLDYNFDHFLRKNRKASPYITLGVEAVEFSAKTDLFDQYGNEYNYWSDGTIRSLPENDVNADQAVQLQRDYVYESDVRSENYDSRGNYNEYAFSIPVGLGVDLKMLSKLNLRFGATYHFTFTDDIDGVNEVSGGDRIGGRAPNERNDRFLFIGAGLRYNLTRSTSGKMEIEDIWSPDELMAFGEDDYDGDGVYDFLDECPQTPFGVEVDERGCPLRKDGRKLLTDEEIYERYLAYMDSTGLYAKIERRAFSSGQRSLLKIPPRKKGEKRFKVKLGEYVGGVPADVQSLMLSIPDVETHISGDTTIFTVGDFDNLPEAIQRKIKAALEGFEDAEIVMQNEYGKIVGLGDESGGVDLADADYRPAPTSPFVFRVQLGAFKNKKPDNAFKHVQNLVVVENENGYTKYMSGAFDNYVEASMHKVEMVNDGWKGAFVVAYKRGQGGRVNMRTAGVTDETVREAKQAIATGALPPKQVAVQTPPEPVKPAEPEFDKSRVKFKIQIGIYKNQVPSDVLSDYMKLNDLAQIDVDNSASTKRYTSGEFSTYQEALEYRNKLIQKGFQTAFVIALLDGELIPIDEARKLIGDTE